MATDSATGGRPGLDAVVQELRPELHRYCARMVGSVVDGEDVVQDALAKAYGAWERGQIGNVRGWLFRIARNTAVDHLRRFERRHGGGVEHLPAPGRPGAGVEQKELAALAFSLFLRLTPVQRSCVILKDVMGYSLAEVAELVDSNVPAVKAALHRGRARLRSLARTGPERPVPLPPPEAALLSGYVERFNARDFDGVRAMLARDVRLDLVGRVKRQGVAEVGEYFGRYAEAGDWRLGTGWVESRPAVLVFDPLAPGAPPIYFMLLEFREGRVAHIRDFRYARHVMREAPLTVD